MTGSVLRSELIPASGRVAFGPANLFFIRSATANVTVTFSRGGSPYGAIGVGAGYIKRNVLEWDRGEITGAAGTVVEFFIGTEAIAEDDTDYRAQIATISGVTLTSEAPASVLATPAVTNVANGAASTVAANPLRRRITVAAPPGNTGEMYVQAVGAGAGRGLPLQGGTFIEIRGTYAFDVRNDSGAAQNFTVYEES